MAKRFYYIDTRCESYKTRFGKSYATLSVFTLKFCFDRSYANTKINYAEKHFIISTPPVNVMKLFLAKFMTLSACYLKVLTDVMPILGGMVNLQKVN